MIDRTISCDDWLQVSAYFCFEFNISNVISVTASEPAAELNPNPTAAVSSDAWNSFRKPDVPHVYLNIWNCVLDLGKNA